MLICHCQEGRPALPEIVRTLIHLVLGFKDSGTPNQNQEIV